MNLVYYPNPILFQKCSRITVFDETLKTTISEMSSLMELRKGMGLAANQVGLPISLFIIKDLKGNICEFINPSIVSVDGSVLLNEGCLSAPGVFLPVARAESVVLDFQNMLGENKRIQAEGIECRAILHELDHINGEFYFDKVNRKLRKLAIKKLSKVI